ncbi:hypothetical protein MTO96_020878 [Rhipicephalus appendiculatus]
MLRCRRELALAVGCCTKVGPDCSCDYQNLKKTEPCFLVFGAYLIRISRAISTQRAAGGGELWTSATHGGP